MSQSMHISSDALAGVMEDILSQYGSNVTDIMKDEVKKASDEAVKTIQSLAPRGSGKYAKSWKIQKMTVSSDGVQATIGASKPYYRLTHLLEHGHYKVLWGKDVGGEVAPRPHIRPGEEAAEKALIEGLSRRLQT